MKSLFVTLVLLFSMLFGDNAILHFTDEGNRRVAYPGGEPAKYEFFRENFRYPKELKNDENFKQVVNMTGVVNTDGYASDIKLLTSGVHPLIADEAKRVFGLMKWIPARKDGVLVKATVVLKAICSFKKNEKSYWEFYDLLAEDGDTIWGGGFQLPDYPGGDDALIPFFQKNIRYPEEALKSGVSGKTVIDFVLHKDGRLSEIKPNSRYTDVCPLLQAEAIRFVQSLPKLIPPVTNTTYTDDSGGYSEKLFPCTVRYNISFDFSVLGKGKGEIILSFMTRSCKKCRYVKMVE